MSLESLDAGLDHQLVLIGPEAREVEHQRFVAPGQDVGRVRRDLVGQRLATGRRLGDLEQQARGEDPHPVETRQEDRLDAGQFVDRWHAANDATHETAPSRATITREHVGGTAWNGTSCTRR